VIKGVGKELASPLQDAIQSLDSISSVLTPEQKALLEPARQKLLQSLTALEKVAKIPTNPLPAQMASINMVQIGQRVVQQFKRAAEDDDILLTADFSSDEILAYADPSQISDVLEKLVTNALRSSPHGGQVSLRIEKMLDGQIHALVRNSVSDKDTHQLPPLINQDGADSSSRRSTNGGQTLGQVKDVITSHGGKVWAEATPGQGSVLHFTLLPPA
jgi:two-component system, NtrC family, sensor histidine kinase KinB